MTAADASIESPLAPGDRVLDRYVVVERFEDPLLAPEQGRRGNYVTLLFRVQLLEP